MGQRDTLCNDYGKDRGNLSKTASFPGFGVMRLLLLLAAVLLAAGTPSPATRRGVEMPLSAVGAGCPAAAGGSCA